MISTILFTLLISTKCVDVYLYHISLDKIKGTGGEILKKEEESGMGEIWVKEDEGRRNMRRRNSRKISVT